jgi:hypothetical protein
LTSPGVDFRQIQARLREQLGTVGVVLDVEDALLGQEHLWLDPRFAFVSTGSEPRKMRVVVNRLTRREVLDAWQQAFTTCWDSLQATSAEVRVLCFHPSLFSARRNEFYSTLSRIDLALVRGVIDRVVVLIDDVYDMMRRLSERQGLYELQAWLRDRLQAQGLSALLREEDRAMIPGASGNFLHLQAEAVTAILNQIIWWRRFDMTQGEALASGAEAHLTVLGVKHPSDTLRQLLRHPTLRTTYLSHPITRPRNDYNRAREVNLSVGWPRVVEDSNSLSAQLAARGIALVLPTAIDELRFEQPSHKFDVYQRPFRLRERWPAVSEPSELISAEEEPAGLPELRPMSNVDEENIGLGSAARSLESLIFSDVPFRDHYLVSHTDSFLVYRPLYDQGKFSGGVAAEIEHWQEAWRASEHSRRAVFIHAVDDVRVTLENVDALDLLRHQLTVETRKRLLHSGVPSSSVSAIMQGHAPVSGMLDTNPIDQGVIVSNALGQVLDDTVRQQLIPVLTGIADEELLNSGEVVVIITRSERPTEQQVGEISQFLKGEPVYKVLVDPYKYLPRCLGTNVTTWAAQLLGIEAASD